MKENEWISIKEQLPPPEKKCLVGSENYGVMSELGEDVLCSLYNYRSQTHYFEWGVNRIGITHWKKLKEKRPDFSKLKEGDLIVIIPKHHNKYFAGYIISLDDDSVQITIGNKDYQGFHESFIKKITRINLEEKTFEDI
jgi:hypothetical protein